MRWRWGPAEKNCEAAGVHTPVRTRNAFFGVFKTKKVYTRVAMVENNKILPNFI